MTTTTSAALATLAAALFAGYLVGAAVTKAQAPGCPPSIVLHRMR